MRFCSHPLPTEAQAQEPLEHLKTTHCLAVPLKSLTNRSPSCPVAQPDGAFRHHKHMPVINVVIGGLCWLLVTKHLCMYSWRCWRSHVLKKYWCAVPCSPSNPCAATWALGCS